MRRRDRFECVIAICGRLALSPAPWVSADRFAAAVATVAAAAAAAATERAAPVASNAGLAPGRRKHQEVHSIMDTVVHRGEKVSLWLSAIRVNSRTRGTRTSHARAVSSLFSKSSKKVLTTYVEAFM